MHIRAVLAFCAIFLAVSPAPAEDVWIDTDPALGLPLRDVDDAFALAQALHSPEIQIRGISVTYGNGPLAHALEAAREIVRRCGTGSGVNAAMVHAGAASAGELGTETDATRALIAALRERPLVYVALGPLTNLATLLQRQPNLASRLTAVVILASRAPGERFRVGRWNPYPFHDANFEKDVPAMAEILAHSGLTLRFVPMTATLSCTMTPRDLDALAQAGSAGAWLAEHSRSWLRLWRWLFLVDGGPMFDSVAILAVTHRQLLSSEVRFVRIEDATARPRLVAASTPGGHRAEVVVQVRPEASTILHERLRTRPRD